MSINFLGPSFINSDMLCLSFIMAEKQIMMLRKQEISIKWVKVCRTKIYAWYVLHP